MAVNLTEPEKLHPVQGVALAACTAGLKSNGNSDMALIACEAGTQAAAVFTQNAFCAAPVIIAREHIAQSSPRFLLINAGNANAGTGKQGLENALNTCTCIAEHFGQTSQQVLPFSTGVINQQLDMDVMHSGIESLVDGLGRDNWSDAAAAIMTTDTVAKGFSEQMSLAGARITVTGISKGSGMICPNMATMLAFIATDARVEAKSLQRLLERSNARSFNSITVDGDTSTNDACVLLATGSAGGDELSDDHPQWPEFTVLIERACKTLAQAIIRDGEGATKFIEVSVRGGIDANECRQVAYTIAHSPLIKTAFFASDPNLGRLLAAVGRSGLNAFDISSVSMRIDEVDIIVSGEPASDYTEERGQAVMSRDEITVFVDLGRGDVEWTIWTTDLSYDYVRINAEYRS
ncbi:MAG: bifunctional glutamate N-acetyltransferase/amino-acid acetyltransferase ArgJ [Pseudomonadota bacterium]